MDKKAFIALINSIRGEFLTKWIVIEYCIDCSIAKSFISDRESQKLADLETFVSSYGSFDKKTDCLKNAFPSDEAKKIIERLRQLYPIRNRLAHKIIDLEEPQKQNYEVEKLTFIKIGDYGKNATSFKLKEEYILKEHAGLMKELDEMITEFGLYLT